MSAGPECGPICWTTGHHHDPETCDGCRRLADTFFGSGAALSALDVERLREAIRRTVDASTQRRVLPYLPTLAREYAALVRVARTAKRSTVPSADEQPIDSE